VKTANRAGTGTRGKATAATDAGLSLSACGLATFHLTYPSGIGFWSLGFSHGQPRPFRPPVFSEEALSIRRTPNCGPGKPTGCCLEIELADAVIRIGA